MSGLFSRLAQQHLNQRTLNIKPAQSPVFPMEINKQYADVSDANKEQMEPHTQLEPTTQIKKNDAVMNNYSDTPVSNSPARNASDVVKPKNHTFVTPSLTPVINPTFKVSAAHELKTPSLITPLLTPEIKPLIQPQLSENNDSLQMPFVSDNDKETLFSKHEDTKLSPENNSINKQGFGNHQVLPPSISNRKEQLTQKFSKYVQDENQTTINISIGQIEIRATQPEKIEKKTPARLDQNRSNALEEYHQKRVRGER